MRIGKVIAKIFAASTTLSSFILNRSALDFQVARHKPIALLGQICRPSQIRSFLLTRIRTRATEHCSSKILRQALVRMATFSTSGETYESGREWCRTHCMSRLVHKMDSTSGPSRSHMQQP
jgi:hypothetical protein